MESFASGVNLYKLIWIYAIGSVLGYLVEMGWCYLRHGYFESRKGVIYGPISPVYGFGAVVMTLSLYRIASINGLYIFLISAVIGGLFEYICSFVQEKVLGTVSWEYSHTPLNLHGRTNLAFSICWGFLGFVFIRHTFPTVSQWIEWIPNQIGIPLTWAIVIYFVFDMLVSALAIRRQVSRCNHRPARTFIARFLDRHYPDERLRKIFPNMILDKTAAVKLNELKKLRLIQFRKEKENGS